MGSDNEFLKRYKEPYEDRDDDDEGTRNRPDWQSREGMMSEEEVRRLSAERGKPEVGAVRADQSGRPGYQPEGDAVRRADEEGGPSGELKRKRNREVDEQPQTPASDWQKYDWA